MSKPIDPLQQAGGGASETARTLTSINPSVLKNLTHIYEIHADPTSHLWSRDQIHAFLASVQHQEASPAADELRTRETLDMAGFLAWMTSSQGAATEPPKEQDLSWPLSSYFISSSHNTYLTGNQLYSDSSTKPYTDVLLRGGRCIEIDVWDGDDSDVETSSESSSDEDVAGKEKKKEKKKKESTAGKKQSRLSKLKETVTSKLEKTTIKDKDEQQKQPAAAPSSGEPDVSPLVEPRVLHGYTLTKEVPFRAVCHAIKEAAFVVSDLPVVVSLEVHCGVEQQQVMVDIMKEVWSGMLVPETQADQAADALPSPGELRRKLLVKVKYVPPGTAAPAVSTQAEESDEELAGSAGDSAAAAKAKAKKKKKPAKIIQALSQMGIFTRGVSFKSLTQPEAAMPTHIFSLSEKKVADVHEKQAAELFNHNKHFLMRTYPWGLRIGSSNLEPAAFWRKGIQIVALNWQNWDEGMMLNEGMFAGTGGYVLKPDGYRPELPGKDAPKAVTRRTLNLTITLLAAQNIPLPRSDKSAKSFRPYIKAELHVDGPEESHDASIPNDGREREGEYKQRSRTYKGCDVEFNTDKLEFRNIPRVLDELSWVRFTVRDDEIGRDDLAAWACVRLDRLGQGYRFVHLMDAEGRVTEGAVLVKIEKKYV